MNQKDIQRFEAKFDKSDGCWQWKKPGTNGYGTFWYQDKMRQAHHITLLLYKSVSLDQFSSMTHADHLCNNRGCVNPDHLQITSSRNNTFRANSIAFVNSEKEKCPSGHLYSEANTIISKTKKGGINRVCRICKQNSNQRNRRVRFETDEDTYDWIHE